MKSLSILLAFCSALLAAPVAAAPAANFGNGPITLVVPFGAGTGADQHARVLSKEIADLLKVPVVVDNRPGANGAIGAQAVKAAPADGRTWLISTNSTQVLSQVLMRKQAFDPFVDLTPVRGLSRGYQVMVVATNSPVRSLPDFIALARSKPGKLTFGSGSAASQMGGELLKYRAGIEMLNVPYKSSATAIADLVGGQIDVMFVDLPLALPLIQAAKIKPLAVSSGKRLAALPQVPTFEEAGVSGYRNAFWSGLYVRAGTPEPMVKAIAQTMAKVSQSSAAAKYRDMASLEDLGISGAELQKLQTDELVLTRAVAAKTGITPE